MIKVTLSTREDLRLLKADLGLPSVNAVIQHLLINQRQDKTALLHIDCGMFGSHDIDIINARQSAIKYIDTVGDVTIDAYEGKSSNSASYNFNMSDVVNLLDALIEDPAIMSKFDIEGASYFTSAMIITLLGYNSIGGGYCINVNDFGVMVDIANDGSISMESTQARESNTVKKDS